MTDDDFRELHAIGADAIDQIAGTLDAAAAGFDGADPVIATGLMMRAVRGMNLDADVLAGALATLALRNRRTLDAAAQMAAVPTDPPARRLLATLAPLLVVLGATLGAFGGVWLAVALGVLR